MDIMFLNQILCLGACSTDYVNTNLPATNFGGTTVFGYWDDLGITAYMNQTVYYATQGTTPNRITTFEFFENLRTSATNYIHFQMIFYENSPNTVRLLYFDMSDTGTSATIGIQGFIFFRFVFKN